MEPSPFPLLQPRPGRGHGSVLGTMTLHLPAWRNRGADSRHKQPGRAALLQTLPLLPPQPKGDLHQQPRIPAPHPQTPLCTSPSRSSGLFVTQKHVRFPLEAKPQHLSTTAHRKPSSCPKIPARGAARCCQQPWPHLALIFLCLSCK